MIRKIWGVARVEYLGFLTSKRVLFMLFAFIFLAEDVVAKMEKIATEQELPLGRFEPFILLFSYKIHVMLVPIVFVVMMSNFPSNEKSGYFTMSRINRTAWVFGEVIYAGLVGLSFILFLFLGTTAWVWKSSKFFTVWSPYMSELYVDFPEIYALNNQLFIKTETLAQGEPTEVMLHSVSLMFLYLLFLALLLMLFKLLSLKRIGIFFTVSITIIGATFDGYSKGIKWIFPITQSIYETHFHSYYAMAELPLYYSYIYFCVLIVGLLMINQWLVKRHIITED
ncbi:MAG: hypothetical protein LUH14_07990 [Clostridiaceae bacterium]|nr:hypothetical protein [Clostridiaceae bacterium]